MPLKTLKPRRIAAAVLVAFLAATTSVPAVAQDDPTTVQARARFKEGVEAYDKGKFEEARLLFLQAYTLKKHPAVLLNLAQSSAKSGHYLDASKYFQQFLKEADATAAQKRDAEKGLADVRQKVARIEVVAPAGTEITLDDQRVGTTPMEPLDVEPGQHTVKSPSSSVTVIATVGQKVEAKLTKDQASPPPVTPTPAPTPQPAPTDAQPSPKDPDAKETNIFSRPETMVPVYVGLAAGGVGLTGAILFGVFRADAQSKADTVAQDIRDAAEAQGLPTTGVCNRSDATNFQRACRTLRDNNDKVDTNATIANVSLVIMGIGFLTAGIWYLAGPKKDDPKTGKTWLTPYAGKGGGGAMLGGTF